MPQEIGYLPAALDIDYPDRELNRVTTFLRLFTFVPIGIILALLSPTIPGGPAHEAVGSERAVILVLGSEAWCSCLQP